MKSYLTLFVLGAILGTFLDAVQTYAGVAYYTDPFLFKTAWWVPLLFGGAVVLIGVTHARIHPLFSKAKQNFFVSLIFLILACLTTAYLNTSSLQKAFILLGLYLFSWGIWDRTGFSLLLAGVTAFIGCATEIFLGSIGLYHYTTLDLFGIPYWLFFLYLHVSQTAGYLGRVLLKKQNLLLAFLLFFVSFPCWGEERVEHYREIATTRSFPYHFEGLAPLFKPHSKEHYQFVFDESHRPLRIIHFDKEGNIAMGEDGWAICQFAYDEENRLTETAFYTATGLHATSSQLGFSKEEIQYPQNKPKRTFYVPKGKGLKPLKKTQELDSTFFNEEN